MEDAEDSPQTGIMYPLNPACWIWPSRRPPSCLASDVLSRKEGKQEKAEENHLVCGCTDGGFRIKTEVMLMLLN